MDQSHKGFAGLPFNNLIAREDAAKKGRLKNVNKAEAQHELAPEMGQKTRGASAGASPSTSGAESRAPRHGGARRRSLINPSSTVLYVYLCAKMHFCIQHNRNRCGRFNINAVANVVPPMPAPPCFGLYSAFVCVCCGHYSELHSQFAWVCEGGVFLRPRLCVCVCLPVCPPPAAWQFAVFIFLGHFRFCRTGCPLCVLFERPLQRGTCGKARPEHGEIVQECGGHLAVLTSVLPILQECVEIAPTYLSDYGQLLNHRRSL